MTAAIVPGSLAAIASQHGTSVAQTFIDADAIILVDTSASMERVDDPRTRKSRYTRACDELAKLQQSLPGKVAVISFSTLPVFCPNGVPEMLGLSTGLAQALRFAHVADGCGIQFIVISDGQPDSETDALKEARKFKSPISCIHIGPEGGEGAQFLRDLAAASGGQFGAHAAAENLASGIQKLLTVD